MIEEKKYVNSYYFVKKLSQYSKKNDSIITDMGFSFTTSHQAMDVKQGQTFFTNSGHAPMGWGLPAAIGNHYANIKNKNFTAKPNQRNCMFCDFKDICPSAIKD